MFSPCIPPVCVVTSAQQNSDMSHAVATKPLLQIFGPSNEESSVLQRIRQRYQARRRCRFPHVANPARNSFYGRDTATNCSEPKEASFYFFYAACETPHVVVGNTVRGTKDRTARGSFPHVRRLAPDAFECVVHFNDGCVHRQCCTCDECTQYISLQLWLQRLRSIPSEAKREGFYPFRC